MFVIPYISASKVLSCDLRTKQVQASTTRTGCVQEYQNGLPVRTASQIKPFLAGRSQKNTHSAPCFCIYCISKPQAYDIDEIKHNSQGIYDRVKQPQTQVKAMKIWIFIALFFLILMAITLVNYKINNEFKIESSWLALGLAPVVIWLLTTQQLSEFSGFGLAFKLKEVTSTPVSLQLDGNLIKPEQISHEEKGGIDKIESFKRNRVAAITLELGKRGYYINRAIQQYLIELTPLSFFKYVLFESQSGEFRGIISGAKLLEVLHSDKIDLVKLMESGDISAINGVSTIAIPSGSSKQKSLQLMDSHGLAELPVVNEFKSFIGIVERDKITSSIVAQLVSSPKTR